MVTIDCTPGAKYAIYDFLVVPLKFRAAARLCSASIAGSQVVDVERCWSGVLRRLERRRAAAAASHARSGRRCRHALDVHGTWSPDHGLTAAAAARPSTSDARHAEQPSASSLRE